jgi:hypothetical protein
MQELYAHDSKGVAEKQKMKMKASKVVPITPHTHARTHTHSRTHAQDTQYHSFTEIPAWKLEDPYLIPSVI